MHEFKWNSAPVCSGILGRKLPDYAISEILIQIDSQASEGIACALVITLANVLRLLSKLFNKNIMSTKNQYSYNVGPLIGDVRWADVVIASSNYIRHKDEWVEKSNNKDSKNSNIEKYNVDTLEKSGLINPREGKYSSLDLVKHLNIEKWETLFQNISNWLNDCLPNHPGFRQNDIVLPEN